MLKIITENPILFCFVFINPEQVVEGHLFLQCAKRGLWWACKTQISKC